LTHLIGLSSSDYFCQIVPIFCAKSPNFARWCEQTGGGLPDPKGPVKPSFFQRIPGSHRVPFWQSYPLLGPFLPQTDKKLPTV
jgi:hypothetical protein